MSSKTLPSLASHYMLLYVTWLSTRNKHISLVSHLDCSLILHGVRTSSEIHAESSHLAFSWPNLVRRIPVDCVCSTKDVKYNDNGEIQESGDVVDCARLASRMASFQETSQVYLCPLHDKDDSVKVSYLKLWVGDKGLDVFEGLYLRSLNPKTRQN